MDDDAGSSLGLRHGALHLAPPSGQWTGLFENERRRIAIAIAPLTAVIEHIGSTAVPGLPAKPILDVGVRAAEPDHGHVARALVELGYIDRGVGGGRLFIRLRDADVRTHNLHLYDEEDPEWERHLALRDALRADPALRREYADLKRTIIEALGGQRAGYAERKSAFIRCVLEGHASGG
jgi:GrpB-like predicted nucleotidyltransferase (UPF0157 family)